MRKLEMIVVTIVCCAFYAALTFAQSQTAGVTSREMARDGIILFEKELVLDIPEVSSLCDQMDIVKSRVNVGDCNLYCEVEGDGVPIVLLHGGPGATHHYFHPFFSMAKDFAKVIYYDQRGCGLSDYKKGNGYSIEQAVEDLENLRKSLKVEKWIVLGNSYGGLLAQCYVIKYPENVSGLILVTSCTGVPVKLESSRQYEFISKEERAKISSINSNNNLTEAQKFYNAFLNGDWKRQCYYKPSKERIAQIVTYDIKHDPCFTAIMDPSLDSVNLRDAFKGCPIPTIIMESRWDLTWDTDKPEILHKNHPNAQLIVFENSAHMPFGDEPEKFFDTLQDFVLKLPKIASADLQQWQEYLSKRKKEEGKRERARDGIVHIEKGVVLNIPQVPRLCDQIDGVKRRVNIGDCELYCEIEGNGIPMVLLHGGPGATHHYFHPSFSRAKDFAKIIYYDQRGCGISDYKKGKGYSIEQVVSDLESLRQSLNINKWVVIGSSYGGVLAQCYTVKYPESVSGLVLVGSGVAMPVVMKSTRQYEFISKEEQAKLKAIRSNNNLSLVQSLYNASLNGDWKRQSYYKPTTVSIAQSARYEWKHDFNFNSIMSREKDRVDLEGAFDECPIPTIIMEGKWDLTWNTDKPGILHKNHPNAQLIFFEESAHLPFDDEPEKFFTTLRDFVLKLPKIASADLQQWQKYLSNWKKEKAKQVKQKEEEKQKEDPFLASEMTEVEAQAIEEFCKIRTKILTGEKYENTSTPLRVFLSYLSALHSHDIEAVKRICVLNLDKMGMNLTSEVIAVCEQELIQFDILRSPLPPEQPEHGTFWPIYVRKNNETILADTLLPVYWKGMWMWFGNTGPESQGNWRSQMPQMKSVLEKFGK